MAPVHEQTWESFGRAWEVDVRQAFTSIRTALTTPLAPGSLVVAMSSGAALAGSPLSGGYAGAKATVRFLARYAAEESTRAGLGIHVHGAAPPAHPRHRPRGGRRRRATPTAPGVERDVFAARLAPALTAEQVGKAVVGLASDGDRTGRRLPAQRRSDCSPSTEGGPTVLTAPSREAAMTTAPEFSTADRALPPRAARALLPHPRVDPRRPGRGAGDLRAGVAGLRRVRGAVLGAAVALRHRDADVAVGGRGAGPASPAVGARRAPGRPPGRRRGAATRRCRGCSPRPTPSSAATRPRSSPDGPGSAWPSSPPSSSCPRDSGRC